VLDLYAGTGALGIEALSRGARYAVLVDSDPAAVHIIRYNVAQCRFVDRAAVWRSAAQAALDHIVVCRGVFDLIVADPPYDTQAAAELVETTDRNRILSATGLLVVEHRKSDMPAPSLATLAYAGVKTVGDTAFSRYRPAPGSVAFGDADPAGLPPPRWRRNR